MISLALDTAIKITAILRAMGGICPDCGSWTQAISAKYSVCGFCGTGCERRTKDEARQIVRGEE
jgi:predicted molibdopterin-dependent oxidoreductase YjgC